MAKKKIQKIMHTNIIGVFECENASLSRLINYCCCIFGIIDFILFLIDRKIRAEGPKIHIVRFTIVH